MAACHEVADVGRAVRWVTATADWLATLPSPPSCSPGICRVHRSQVLRDRRATGRAPRPRRPGCPSTWPTSHVLAAAEGYYQVGELRRLVRRPARPRLPHTGGRTELGRDPQPGHALLRMAEGAPGPAAASGRDGAARPCRSPAGPSPAACGAGGDRAWHAATSAAARAAVDRAERDRRRLRELRPDRRRRPSDRGSPPGRGPAGGRAARARRGRAASGTGCGARHDTARVRVLLARAYRALGDIDSAAPRAGHGGRDVRRARRQAGPRRGGGAAGLRDARPGGLTAREVEVLTCLAAGRTNREIAAALVISEKTVGRHLAQHLHQAAGDLSRGRGRLRPRARPHGANAPAGTAPPDGPSAR